MITLLGQSTTLVKDISNMDMIPLDWEKDLCIYADASNVASGSVLSQKDEKKHDHTIYFASCHLVQAERD